MMVRTAPAPTPFARIDAKRIAGNTFVVALHALAFALMMVPTRWDPPAPVHRELVVMPDIVPPTPIEPTTPPPVRVPVQQTPPRTTPPQRIEQAPAVDPTPVVAETGTEAAVIVEDSGPPAVSFDPGPQVATLRYDAHPAPRYPRAALRRGSEGTVLLRVLVGTDGRPREVTIEKSSGDRDLDRAARDQVATRWTFHPAQQGGRTLDAYALVPIEFILP